MVPDGTFSKVELHKIPVGSVVLVTSPGYSISTVVKADLLYSSFFDNSSFCVWLSDGRILDIGTWPYLFVLDGVA